MSNALHVYVLLDLSASMSGTGLEALKQGVQLLAAALMGMGGPLRAAFIGYESTLLLLRSLTEMDTQTDVNDATNLILQTLEPAGASNVGRALHMVEKETIRGVQTCIYLFTDGHPTDDWEDHRAALMAKEVRVVGVACGLAANLEVLSLLADTVLSVSNVTVEQFAASLRG